MISTTDITAPSAAAGAANDSGVLLPSSSQAWDRAMAAHRQAAVELVARVAVEDTGWFVDHRRSTPRRGLEHHHRTVTLAGPPSGELLQALVDAVRISAPGQTYTYSVEGARLRFDSLLDSGD